MFDMRFKLPELMKANGLRTAYALHQYAKGALTMSAAHRLVQAGESPKRLDMGTLDRVCAVFDIRDMNQLLERDRKPARR